MTTPESRIDYERFQTIPRYDNRRFELDPEEKRTAEILNFGADGRYAVTATLSGDAPIVSKILPGLSLTLKEVFAD